MRLSDAIESFIKQMMAEDEPEVELKRSELAEYFKCAPSQINYVLATRFSEDHGYMTESRRGGGGYIRIVRVVRPPAVQLMYLIHERIGDSISGIEAERLITQLTERELITGREGALMKAAVSARALSLPLSEDLKDTQRARLMKTMLTEIARHSNSESYGG